MLVFQLLTSTRRLPVPNSPSHPSNALSKRLRHVLLAVGVVVVVVAVFPSISMLIFQLLTSTRRLPNPSPNVSNVHSMKLRLALPGESRSDLGANSTLMLDFLLSILTLNRNSLLSNVISTKSLKHAVPGL
jgi:predicted PurR-regulated permease PerM